MCHILGYINEKLANLSYNYGPGLTIHTIHISRLLYYSTYYTIPHDQVITRDTISHDQSK